MRGRFSIEWMAQSSQSPGARTSSSDPAACGTHSESLPGFYCRHKAQDSGGHQRTQSLDPQHQDPHSSHTTEAGFSSGTEEETSGYESEGGACVSPAAPPSSSSSSSSSSSDAADAASPPSPPAGRRPRTAFTAEQISSMEKAFKRNAYLGTQDKAELCRKLNLSDKQIRNWFQNRRMKLKRTVQDALAHACQANVASQLMHYQELQAYRPGPYPRYHPAAAAAPEGPPAASYVHPHGLQYSSPLPSAPSLDSFYQYSSLPGVVLPPYPTYPQYY